MPFLLRHHFASRKTHSLRLVWAHDQYAMNAKPDRSRAEVVALKRLQTEAAAELDALLPAILDRAFKGEL